MVYSVILAVRPSQAKPSQASQATACWPPGGLAGMVYNMRGKLFTTYPWNSPARQSELDGGSRCWLIHQILEAFFEDNANSTSVQFAKGKVTVQLSWLKLDAKIMFITLLLLVYFQSPNPYFCANKYVCVSKGLINLTIFYIFWVQCQLDFGPIAKGKVTVQLSRLKLDAKVLFITLFLPVYFQSPNPHFCANMYVCKKIHLSVYSKVWPIK